MVGMTPNCLMFMESGRFVMTSLLSLEGLRADVDAAIKQMEGK